MFYSFIAHTRKSDDMTQPLRQHLVQTAILAQKHAEPWGGEFVYACGLAHDIGKYSTAFQERIRGENHRVDHSTAGGRFLYELHDKSILGVLAAYCITGHHGGLPNGGSKCQDTEDEATLYGRLKRSIPNYSAYKNELTVSKIETFPTRLSDGFDAALFVRMAFSALVDADWLDTEAFCNIDKPPRIQNERLPILWECFSKYIERFLNSHSKISVLNELRTALLKDCLSAAEKPTGLFTLTAPTGSGKTISSLAFALKHAILHKKRRVIYIVPYNTIIEQNAKVFEDILGEENVLIHNSNVQYDGEDDVSLNKRHSVENWNFPLIVTSSVQFFESLFSNKPSKCRKLHNIANSVLIFDESQMIPIPYLLPCVRVIKNLVEQYDCTAVLATATQSALDEYFCPLKPTEITSNPKTLYNTLRRASIQKIEEPLTDEILAQQLLKYERVLCIVNTRRHAQELFSLLHKQMPEGTFHLSTTMYPAHRRQILDNIRSRLKSEGICRVISTSLVESGVDLDFETVYREQSGLDSIVQAAGRCNREGNLDPNKSIVYVFSAAKHKVPVMIQPNIEAYNQIAREHDDLADMQAIQAYFEQLFYNKGDDALDSKKILPIFNNGARMDMSLPFADAAKEFKLIDDTSQQTLYVLHESPELEMRLRGGERNRVIFRKLGQYAVSLFQQDIQGLDELGAIERLDESAWLIPRHHYDEQLGISLHQQGGQAIIL